MPATLSIMHVLRAPVGGLFRHVRDLARAQALAGHQVGIMANAGTGGDSAERAFAELQPHCALGIHRVVMARLPGPGDMAAIARIGAVLEEIRPTILHGHGAKGGLYARLTAARVGARAFYTPHGGVLHFAWASPAGALFLMTERMLLSRTAGLIFVCEYERATFARKVGLGGRPVRVVHNGLWPEDYAAVVAAGNAADVLFIGELRHLKGIDVLIAALAEAGARRGRPVTANIVGDGPDRSVLEAATRRAGLQSSVRFLGTMPAAVAFPLGHCMVIPSRAELFPYVVLEAIAAGLPLIASNVGGIGEALDGEALVPPEDPAALAEKLLSILDDPASAQRAARRRLEDARIRFDATAMGVAITRFYRENVA